MGDRPWRQEQVPNICGNLRGENCYDMIKPGSLACDVASRTELPPVQTTLQDMLERMMES